MQARSWFFHFLFSFFLFFLDFSNIFWCSLVVGRKCRRDGDRWAQRLGALDVTRKQMGSRVSKKNWGTWLRDLWLSKALWKKGLKCFTSLLRSVACGPGTDPPSPPSTQTHTHILIQTIVHLFHIYSTYTHVHTFSQTDSVIKPSIYRDYSTNRFPIFLVATKSKQSQVREQSLFLRLFFPFKIHKSNGDVP